MCWWIIQEDIPWTDTSYVVVIPNLSVEHPALLPPFFIVLEYYYIFILFFVDSFKSPNITTYSILLRSDRCKCGSFVTNIIIFLTLTGKLPQVVLIVFISLYESIYSSMIILWKFGRSCQLLREWGCSSPNFVNIIFLTILCCNRSCISYCSSWRRYYWLWWCIITILNPASISACIDWAATWIRSSSSVCKSSCIINLGFAGWIGDLIPQVVLVPRAWCRGGLLFFHIWISWKQIFNSID